MRDYGIVSPMFWIGKTGRALRKDQYAQRIAFYLITAPQSEMTGVFYCSKMSILNDVGSPFEDPSDGLEECLEGVERALRVLCDVGFCFYDFDEEWVFVKEMARWQVAEKLSSKDNRVINMRKLVKEMPSSIRERFIDRYNDAFCLDMKQKNESPLEAPFEPLRSQEQEQEQEQEQKITNKHSTHTEGLDACDDGLNFVEDSLSAQIEQSQIYEMLKVVDDPDAIVTPVQVIALARTYAVKVNRTAQLNDICDRKSLSVDNVRKCIQITKDKQRGGSYLIGVMANAVNDPKNYHTEEYKRLASERLWEEVDENEPF